MKFEKQLEICDFLLTKIGDQCLCIETTANMSNVQLSTSDISTSMCIVSKKAF
jgi:hypothetical protein